MNWCRRQDFPVPALPITRNLNRKSESRAEEAEINVTPTSGEKQEPSALCTPILRDDPEICS